MRYEEMPVAGISNVIWFLVLLSIIYAGSVMQK